MASPEDPVKTMWRGIVGDVAGKFGSGKILQQLLLNSSMQLIGNRYAVPDQLILLR